METGFDDEEVYRLLEKLRESTSKDNILDINQMIEDIEEPVTGVGDVICLGPHVLMCGDRRFQKAYIELYFNIER